MLAEVDDLEKIESHGMNSHSGNDDNIYLLTRVKVIEDEAIPRIQVQSIKHSSLLFKGCDLRYSDILVLASDKFLVHNLIVHQF